MAERTDLGRLRLLALALLGANLMVAFLVRMIGVSFRPVGGIGNLGGDYFALTAILVATSAGGALIVGLVLLSCFWSHLRGHRRNPFVGDEFLPAYTDLMLVGGLLATSVWVIRIAFT